MSSPALESFLARLYTNPHLLERFMRDPKAAMGGAGLSSAEETSLAALDRAQLLLTAHSFARKRTSRGWRAGARWQRALHEGFTQLYIVVWRWLDGGPRPRWRRPRR